MKIKKNQLDARKHAIQELIQTHAIEDQAALIDLLQKEYGITTNQAAISRDLRTLGVAKRARGLTRSIYELPTVDVFSEIIHFAVKSIVHNEAIIVVNTVSGTADFVGDYLDSKKDLDILGTLAGENVVFVTPKSIKNTAALAAQIAQRVKVKGS